MISIRLRGILPQGNKLSLNIVVLARPTAHSTGRYYGHRILSNLQQHAVVFHVNIDASLTSHTIYNTEYCARRKSLLYLHWLLVPEVIQRTVPLRMYSTYACMYLTSEPISPPCSIPPTTVPAPAFSHYQPNQRQPSYLAPTGGAPYPYRTAPPTRNPLPTTNTSITSSTRQISLWLVFRLTLLYLSVCSCQPEHFHLTGIILGYVNVNLINFLHYNFLDFTLLSNILIIHGVDCPCVLQYSTVHIALRLWIIIR